MPFLSIYIMDLPNFRSSHSKPTPRGGGISFVLLASSASALSFFVALLYLPMSGAGLYLPLIVLPLALVGLLDDLSNLPSAWRYGVQFATALLIVSTSRLFLSSSPTLLLSLCLAFVLTGIINFINFMDGVDGLVAGSMFIALGSAAIHLLSPMPIWALLGSLLGFLWWNWSPAKVFMGDVGSTFLGAVFAGLVLQSPSWSDALVLLLVSTPLLADAFFCVLRRLLAGHRLFQAHRLHLFQRLHLAGWSHSRVSLTYIAATMILALAMLSGGGLPWVISLAVLEVLLGLCLDIFVSVPFSLAAER